MHNTESHHRFIDLRAQGWSLARIAADLQVGKSTLIRWQRKHHRQIADLKNVELEALQEKFLASHEVELSRLTSHLNRVESILASRKLECISTEFLFSMAGALRSQIRKQKVPIDFSPSPSDALPELPDPGTEPPDPRSQTPEPKSETPEPKP